MKIKQKKLISLIESRIKHFLPEEEDEHIEYKRLREQLKRNILKAIKGTR